MKLNKALKNITIPEDLTPKVESYVMEHIKRPVMGWTFLRISIALLTGLLLVWIITGDRNPVTMAEENELKIISIMVVETHTAIWLEPLSGQNGG